MTEERRLARREKLKELRAKKKANQKTTKIYNQTDDVEMEAAPAQQTKSNVNDEMKRRLYQTEEQ